VDSVNPFSECLLHLVLNIRIYIFPPVVETTSFVQFIKDCINCFSCFIAHCCSPPRSLSPASARAKRARFPGGEAGGRAVRLFDRHFCVERFAVANARRKNVGGRAFAIFSALIRLLNTHRRPRHPVHPCLKGSGDPVGGASGSGNVRRVGPDNPQRERARDVERQRPAPGGLPGQRPVVDHRQPLVASLKI